MKDKAFTEELREEKQSRKLRVSRSTSFAFGSKPQHSNVTGRLQFLPSASIDPNGALHTHRSVSETDITYQQQSLHRSTTSCLNTATTTLPSRAATICPANDKRQRPSPAHSATSSPSPSRVPRFNIPKLSLDTVSVSKSPFAPKNELAESGNIE
jgi:hypothetical protein